MKRRHGPAPRSSTCIPGQDAAWINIPGNAQEFVEVILEDMDGTELSEMGE